MRDRCRYLITQYSVIRIGRNGCIIWDSLLQTRSIQRWRSINRRSIKSRRRRLSSSLYIAGCEQWLFLRHVYNGVKEFNQEIIELKDESITSNALKIILEFWARQCYNLCRNKWVKITFLGYVNTLFYCMVESALSGIVLRGHPVLPGRFMQTWNVWKYQSAEMSCWNCWPVFPNEASSLFLFKFLNRMATGGFHRKKETQTKREANADL